jgi:hypothetical protein
MYGELARQRLVELAVQHLERYRKCMAGPHGARNEFQALGKLLFKLAEPLTALAYHVENRQRAEKGRRRECQAVQRRRRQVPDAHKTQDKPAQDQTRQPRHGPVEAGLLE